MGRGAGMVLAIDEKFIFGKKMGIPLMINFKKLGVYPNHQSRAPDNLR